MPKTFRCEEHDKTFKNALGLRMHQALKHKADTLSPFDVVEIHHPFLVERPKTVEMKVQAPSNLVEDQHLRVTISMRDCTVVLTEEWGQMTVRAFRGGTEQPATAELTLAYERAMATSA